MTEKQRPRLLFIANTSWYLWNFRRQMATHLSAREYEIILAAPTDEYSERLATIGQFIPIKLDRKGQNPLAEFATLLGLYRLLRREKPDAVLTWTPKPNIYGSLCCRLLRVPIIPNVAGLGYAFIGGGWLARIAGALYRFAFRRCSVVFFQNAQDLDQFVSASWVRTQTARLLPGSGVDLRRFRPQPLRRDPDFIFLFVGRLLADKGLRELVEAGHRLRDEGAQLRVRIAGFVDHGNPASIGDEELHLWQMENLAEYVGPTDAPEKHYAEADCIVLPSYYREGIPRVLLEAAASARPVITTDAPGCRDAMVDGETGFLCRPRDLASLIEAMRRMMSLPASVRTAMGHAGRTLMEHKFSEDVVLENYAAALSKLSSATRLPPSTAGRPHAGP